MSASDFKPIFLRTMDIFVKPIFGGLLISQDMLLNKRQYQIPRSVQKEFVSRQNRFGLVSKPWLLFPETRSEETAKRSRLCICALLCGTRQNWK